jgi:hypothetical protein
VVVNFSIGSTKVWWSFLKKRVRLVKILEWNEKILKVFKKFSRVRDFFSHGPRVPQVKTLSTDIEKFDGPRVSFDKVVKNLVGPGDIFDQVVKNLVGPGDIFDQVVKNLVGPGVSFDKVVKNLVGTW